MNMSFISYQIQKLAPQSFMVKITWRSDHPWFAIFSVIIYCVDSGNTPYSVCSVPWEDIFSTVGDIFSTSGVFSTVEGMVINVGYWTAPHVYYHDISQWHWTLKCGEPEHPPLYSRYPPTVLEKSPHGTKPPLSLFTVLNTHYTGS